MTSTYKKMDVKERDQLYSIAKELGRNNPSGLYPFILMSDPNVHGDILSSVQNMPPQSTIIYRHYGANDKANIAKNLRQITFERNQTFLIGHDPELAILYGADGVHFKRDAALAMPSLWRRRCPDWIITMAGLKGAQNYLDDISVLDAIFMSSVFPSQSSSAGPAIGQAAFQNLAELHSVPTIALGGITGTTAPQLMKTRAAGIAGRFRL